MKKRFQVVLKITRLSVQDKVTKANFIVKSMRGNEYFTTPNPDLSVILTDIKNLETAAADAGGGGKKLTADMHAKEYALERDLNVLASYVEEIANKPENISNAVAVITSAGMDVKTTPTHGPTQFQANLTGVSGEVKLRTAFVNGAIYHWQMSTDDVTWTGIGVSRKGSFIKSGLTSGTRYHFRVAIEDKSGIGPWSDDVSIIVE